ncbi:hypothetical protein CHUAL_009949 [Chamberlinius hualienensis]
MANQKKPSLIILYTVLPNMIEALNEYFEIDILDSRAVRYLVLQRIAGKDAVLCVPWTTIDKEFLDAAGPQLKVIVTTSAGFEHIDIEECKKRKISIGYLGDVASNGIGEYTIGLMIATARKFKEAAKSVENGDWEKNWVPARSVIGFELRQATVGIVGFGSIGQNIAKRLQAAFSVKQILYCGPNKKSEAEQLKAEYVSFDDLLYQSDFVIACCTVNQQTVGIFNADAFKKMKPTAVFINIARGALVNQEDLYDALVNEEIWAAGLDSVTPEPMPHDHPLISLKNCVVMPHIGTSSQPTRADMFKISINNLIAWSRGQPMPVQLI